MTLIGSKRAQQTLFEMAASQNRAAASGGGGGFLVVSTLDDQTTTDIAVNIATANNTTFSSIPNTTCTFSLGRTQTVLFIATVSGRATAGGGGVYAYGKVFVDGTPYGSTQGGITAIFDSNVAGYYPNVVIFSIPLTGGGHTANVRIATDNATTHWLQYTTKLTVYALGA